MTVRIESVLIPVLRATIERPWLTRVVFARDRWGNPFSDEVSADPNPFLARMWEDGPVVYRRAYGRWFVSGYEECQLLANHPDASAGRDFETLLSDVRPYKTLAPQTKTFFRNWMLLQDGAVHQRLRRLVSRAFTPRRIAELEPAVDVAANRLLDEVEGRDTVEMVRAFNRPLPVNVISSMLGFPEERWEWAGDVVTRMSSFLDPLETFDGDEIDAAVDDFRAYVLELAAQRLRNPRDDLITALARAEDAGDRLSEDELIANAGLLMFAGNDTTTNMLGNSIVALAAHPDQRTLLRGNHELWPNAIEELLRYDTTAVAITRRVSADIAVGDVVIPAGASVNLQLQAANRDPRRWEDPFELRLDRVDPRPLSFGHGLHHCLGHALARMELRVGLRAVLERFGDYRVDSESLVWRRSVVLRGPTRLIIDRG